MRSHQFIILCFLLFALASCKKTKLEGDYLLLVGTWTWTSGIDDNGNKQLRIVFKEKGNYKLIDNNKTLDRGRLVYTNGYLKLISDKLFEKNTYDGRSISKFNTDTLIITKVGMTDQPVSIYIKK